jgi:2-oxo-3-hexenedioate decarboxylase
VSARPRSAIAEDLRHAYATRTRVAPPSSLESDFTLEDGYAVESDLRRLRRSEGRTIVGLKVGYANRAVWRVLRLKTLVWAAMYDNTVQYASGGVASIKVSHMIAPKIEPEIVFKVARPAASVDAASALASVQWFAAGFEIIDCVYPDWQFQPADFVAALGLHASLVVGEPQSIAPDDIPGLLEQLAAFKMRLLRDSQLVEEGAGRNALKSPAHCLVELATAVRDNPVAAPLEPGYLVSTGTLTTSQPCRATEQWSAEVAGLDVSWPRVRLID